MYYLHYNISLFNIKIYYYNLFGDFLILFILIYFLIIYSFIFYLFFTVKNFFEDSKVLDYLKIINNFIVFLKINLNIYNFFKFFHLRLNREAYFGTIEIFNNDLSLYEKKGSKGYIFYFWKQLKLSYKLQILSLILSLFFRIIYFIFIYILYYIFILIIRFFYKNIFLYNFYYIYLYIYIYLKFNIYKYININNIINFWIFYDYIICELVIFFHQLELFINWFTINFISLIYHKNFKFANIILINTGESIPFSNFIKNKIRNFLPFIQHYKQNYFLRLKINLNIYLLDFFFNFILILINIFTKILININIKLDYLLFLLELNTFKFIFQIKNKFDLKYLLLLILILYNNYLLLFIIIYYLYNNISYINICLSDNIIILLNMLLWIIGFIFYYLFYFVFIFFNFFFKNIFFLIYKCKFIIIIFFIFYTFGFDITTIYLLLNTFWYYLGYIYILKFISMFFYNDWYILFWERFIIDNQIIWEITSQQVVSTWLNWIYNSEFIFKDLCINALNNIKGIDTFEKVWVIAGPIAFLMFLLFELKLNEIFLYFFIWIVKLIYCYLYLNLTPFLFIEVTDYYFSYLYFWSFFKFIVLILKYIKIHFFYLYFYWIPYYFNIYYIKIVYFLYSIYCYYKYKYIYNFLNFINVKHLNIYIYFYYIFFINKFFFYYIFNKNIIIIIIKFLNIIFFDLFYSFINWFNLWIYSFFSKIPKFYINIYFFINYWYEMQSNLDLILSYFRFSRFNFNKWIYNLNYIPVPDDELFFSSMFTGTLENIQVSFPLDCWFKNDHQIIIYNINIYIKYWKWQYSIDFQPVTNYMFITKFNDFLLRNYTYIYIYVYIFLYFFFKFIYNLYKTENYFFNSNYLWWLVRKSFNKKFFTNKIHNIQNKNIINKNKYIFFKKIKKNVFSKLNKYLKKNFYNILISKYKYFKKDILYLNKKYTLDSYFYKYKESNYLNKKFLYSNYYSFFYNNFKKYNNKFNFFLAFIYKKNKYIKYIFAQENNVIAEDVWKYPTSSNNINYKYFYKNSKNLSKSIIKYFFFIDKKLFNFKSPNWLLHKNKSTFFFINSKKLDSCSITVSYDFPFDIDFFFICIIPQIILLNFFLYGQEKEAFFLGIYQQRQLIWLLSIILSSLNLDIIWYMFINYLSYWERFQSDEYIQNAVSNGGEEFTYSQIYSEKFFIIDLFWNYRSLYDLEYNYFSSFKFNNIINDKLNLLYYLQIFFIIFLLIFYYFKFLDLKFKKLRWINFKLIILINTNYQLKLLSFKNFILKK